MNYVDYMVSFFLLDCSVRCGKAALAYNALGRAPGSRTAPRPLQRWLGKRTNESSVSCTLHCFKQALYILKVQYVHFV